MTLAFMLDTNVCIRLLRYRPPHLVERFAAHADAIAMSTVVQAELIHGAAKSTRPDHSRSEVYRLTRRTTVLAFDEAAADQAGSIMHELGSVGRQIGHYDMLIAGHARSRGLIVVTGDADFGRVDGLRCEDWLAAT